MYRVVAKLNGAKILAGIRKGFIAQVSHPQLS